ncbi:OLC1v1010613C1 [Oldenlandia corymbosa var. corymbosa]|uniref:OLC1v1010613C1 n=1 Tax=Oldenlandia corymbosa var. corymbosa TaxID=529605 RepID=A0AAV1DRS8_OLDCO|nr:OLC1v1010613C1 [Oldenlandia corymbosa var. corymbosa]
MVKNTPQLRQAIEDVQRAIRESPSWDSLSDARKRIIDLRIREAVHEGIALEGDKRDRFNAINQELAKLSQKFLGNMLDSTKKFEKIITDKNDIEGLTSTALELAAQTAVSKGHKNATAENGPRVLTLDSQSYDSVMEHARNRNIRKELYLAYLRMEGKMASLDDAMELLEKLRTRWKTSNNSLKVKVPQKLIIWNPGTHCFGLRGSGNQNLEFNEEELRPYFSFPKVMEGLFNLANMLFGIKIEAADGLVPVWDEDVKFYRVTDSSGSPIAFFFYLDPYSRPSEKQQGAWMLPILNRSRVKIVFHEFGHALQHMLTREDEGIVAGSRHIEHDAMELPSQFLEYWCNHRDTLMSIAKHYESGNTLPDSLYEKLLAARTFLAGSKFLNQVLY